MKLRELAEKCKERGVDCNNCPYIEECKALSYALEDISPIGLIELVEGNWKIK